MRMFGVRRQVAAKAKTAQFYSMKSGNECDNSVCDDVKIMMQGGKPGSKSDVHFPVRSLVMNMAFNTTNPSIGFERNESNDQKEPFDLQK